MAKQQSSTRKLSQREQDTLLETLQTRFERNTTRHPGISWKEVSARLQANPAKLLSLAEMERTGGEPDVVLGEKDKNDILFCDCAAETPKDRRSLCYDDEALASRKANKPAGSAVALAEGMGIELLTEEQYQNLQTLGEFDLKTSSWLRTPNEVRKLGGAIFGDRRFDRVFIYHNGAESYYAARGFRGVLKV